MLRLVIAGSRRWLGPSLWVFIFLIAGMASAQTNLAIYTDQLVNGFQDWSWASHDLFNTSPVHSGSDSISVSDAAWTAISFENAGFNGYQGGFSMSGYTNFSFWANGGSGGGQQLQVYVESGMGAGPDYLLPVLTANTWQQFVIPLSALGVANVTNAYRFTIQITANGTTGTFYLDDIQLGAGAGPATVHVNVNANQTVRTADARWAGLNTAVWDGYLGAPETVNMLKEIGTSFLRFPGGSLSDQYDWRADTTLTNTWQWASPFSAFFPMVTNIGAQAIITVNYGTGTPAEAAAWVKCANITNNLGFKYWEIGNECYGGWETDSNAVPNDPYTYAVRAQQYIQQMKAVDPTIHIGVVATPGEDNFANYTTHAATNPVTHAVHYGWTPVMLSTLKNLGVTPDFIINHRYAESSGQYDENSADCDVLLLLSTPAWAGDAADLRMQLNDYLGTEATNIEMLATENNSDSGAQGRQSTSLVNALYYADSAAQIMQTEFNSYIWWDLRNGSDYSGSFDPTLYGWRDNGDIGMVGSVTNFYPPYYAARLMQHFVRGGESIVSATSDYSLLSAYASRHADGSVSLLVVNKDVAASLNTQISITGFAPGPAATCYIYGEQQDNAAETGVGSPDVLQTNAAIAGANFSYNFPPYSLTLLTFNPDAPQLMPASAGNGRYIFQLQGQGKVTYEIQTSTNLVNWNSNSMVTMTGNTGMVTNSQAGGVRFWRAVWLP